MSNVLIVDDEAALYRLVRRVIEREGVNAAEAAKAEDALRMASQDSPQVTFCDVELGVKPVPPDDSRPTLRASLEEHAIRVRDGVSTRTAPLS